MNESERLARSDALNAPSRFAAAGKGSAKKIHFHFQAGLFPLRVPAGSMKLGVRPFFYIITINATRLYKQVTTSKTVLSVLGAD